MKTQEVPHPARTAPLALLPGDALLARLLSVLLVIWRTMTTSRKVAVGSAIVGFFIVVGLFGPFFMTIDPNATSHLFIAPPSPSHLLGTTVVGEDIFSQLIYGTRTSVFWGLGTGLLVTLLSVVVGLGQARVLRSQTLSMRSREFVTAARASGEHAWRIIFFEIFPNEIGLVVAGFVSTTIYVVLTWAALEFLGLGDGSIPSWGSILYWAQQAGALGGGLWWWFIPPGACIAILGAGLSLINFGIDEIADPRLRYERSV